MGTKDFNMPTPAVYVVGDMGTSGYMLQFEANFDQKSFSFINTVDALSSGQYQIISGAEDLFSPEYQKTVVVVSGMGHLVNTKDSSSIYKCVISTLFFFDKYHAPCAHLPPRFGSVSNERPQRKNRFFLFERPI